MIRTARLASSLTQHFEHFRGDAFRVPYSRLSRLIDELVLARADGRYGTLLRQLAKMDFLILDDLGLAPLTSAQGRELLEILDDRTGLKATCIASQLPFEMWHGQKYPISQ